MANYDYRKKDQPPVHIPQFKTEWIESGIVLDTVNYAEKLGEALANERFTTSQIRNFYGELKRIQLRGISEEKSAFHLLHPKLAYAAKRAEKNEGKGAIRFKDEILKAHQAVRIDQEGFEYRFQNFCDLCEAILAFHKAKGGKDQ